MVTRACVCGVCGARGRGLRGRRLTRCDADELPIHLRHAVVGAARDCALGFVDARPREDALDAMISLPCVNCQDQVPSAFGECDLPGRRQEEKLARGVCVAD